MVSSLALAAVLLAAPTAEQKPAKPAKPTPEQRLAKVDHARLELHMGGRVYGRFLDGPAAYGAALQLGLGVRLVRGLYLAGEANVGAHAMPVTAAGQVFLGIRHELRMSQWVRPSYSLGYSHAVEVSYAAHFDAQCGCMRTDPWFDVSARSELDLAQRNGVEAGLGLRFPFRWAPRLSAYVRADANYYFDALPRPLQVSGGFGVQVVF
jgi:hypothetical protein